MFFLENGCIFVNTRSFYTPFNPIHILTPYAYKINAITIHLSVDLTGQFNRLQIVKICVLRTRRQPTKLPKT
jgi:Tfp pilus assembly protein PilZ